MALIDPSIFKAYDVRGLYPAQINEDVARQIGHAFVAYLRARRIAVSRDMRLSSPTLAAAFIEGALRQGADVADFGMMGTDMLYYAVAREGFDGGAQITASHNPKGYNGVKLVRRDAMPLSGDADRCFFIDGDGEFVPGDFVTALLAEAFLRKHPGAKIIYDVRASYAVKDTVQACGGSALMNRVGHSFFKNRMRKENAVFGGEVTGHYYFRDNFYADNGFIPALIILELMSVKGRTLSELLAPLRKKYFISGEINTAMPDMPSVRRILDELAHRYNNGRVYRMDGVSVEFPTWHFNVRPSNTEPLLRLNLEAKSGDLMAAKREEVLALIRS